ncbi:hypothetical protein TcasGA2_TC007084 [Tribolium castaneum]|uniref:Uncharacterized protein n=1 Tax=Tribolium castaneum TaxID=7070 RepID=D2A1L8_TRICA|nr:hypothetical protein TcasGA2_TC007084 [Tribolium castaneum]
MASTACCKIGSDGTHTVIKQCILKTDEGEFDCECICKCECTGDCKNCTCDCKCTPETAQKIQTADGVKYRCECKCKC